MGKESVAVYDLGGGSMIAIYLRVSTNKQDVKSQRHAINQWCAAQGYDKASLQEYIDEGISGATLNRPCMRALLADIAANKVSKVILFLADRIARDMLDGASVLKALRDAGATVEYPGKGVIDLNDPKAVLFEIFALYGAQDERSKIQKRIKSGIAVSRATKKPTWGRQRQPNNIGAFGWRKAYDPALIQKIQAKRAKGRSYREIADDLEMSVNKVFRIARRSGDAQT